MFFRKKNQIALTELVDILIVKGLYEDMLSDEKNSNKLIGIKKLSSKQSKELFIFHMFAYTKSINDTFYGEKICSSILDKFHFQIYLYMHEGLLEKVASENFQILVQQCYTEYYKCFEVKDYKDLTLQIGEVLSNNLFNTKTDVLKHSRVGIFAMTELISKKEFVNTIKKDYKIIVSK